MERRAEVGERKTEGARKTEREGEWSQVYKQPFGRVTASPMTSGYFIAGHIPVYQSIRWHYHKKIQEGDV